MDKNEFREVAFEVAALVGKDNDLPFVRRIENSVVAYRATILKQQYDRDGRFPSGTEETITIPVAKASPAECIGDDVECKVVRSIQKIPRPIRKNAYPIPFSFVGSLTQKNSFTFAKPEEIVLYKKGSQFMKTSPFYMYYNDYVYIANYEGSKITIRGVFGDPRELLDLLDCENKPCKTTTELDEDMRRVIKMMIFEELRQFNILPQDKAIKINEQ